MFSVSTSFKMLTYSRISLNWETNISVSSSDKSNRARKAISLTSFSSTLTSFLLIDISLRYKTIRTSMEENYISNTFLIKHSSQQSCETKTETAVWRAAILEKIQIKLDRIQVDSFFSSLFDQNIITVFSLCSCRDFHPFPQQVKAFGL